jgi:hypothetical protein
MGKLLRTAILGPPLPVRFLLIHGVPPISAYLARWPNGKLYTAELAGSA